MHYDMHSDGSGPRCFADLEAMTTDDLYDFAGLCDVEPADERGCLACAAYLFAQRREEPDDGVVVFTDEEMAAMPKLFPESKLRQVGWLDKNDGKLYGLSPYDRPETAGQPVYVVEA